MAAPVKAALALLVLTVASKFYFFLLSKRPGTFELLQLCKFFS